ncbi:polysaccharide deacetylase family protein [Couchioplanes caeruleus]|uniref:polysaccharide deacetylase family protein n=1 Tax=Couchioplanes caeruleus TaxID=56438 RepID=UPI0020BE4247|nr:polysaccharide deacetylase family protein [Couchioplanes caeruleus]UQU62879.1 polysaccharide deacetylase family protein [Couchioplanes caeruleus]
MSDELSPMPLVLMYHSVEAYDADPYKVTVHPSRFERQLRWLGRRGLRGVAMCELLEAYRAGRGRGLVGLTFDDGYRDFVTEVLPALRRYGFTATVFVVAGSLGGSNAWDEPGPRKELMTAAEVRQVAAAGMEVGSHSLAHVHLPRVGEDELVDQVRRSRLVLTEITGSAVTGFCYPYGDAGPREIRAVEETGYDYACAVRVAGPAGRHAIPRTFIGDRDTGPRLVAKLARHRLTTGRAAR